MKLQLKSPGYFEQVNSFAWRMHRLLVRSGANALAAIESFAWVQNLWLLAIFLLLLASYMPLEQDADGLLLSIISIQKLTVFYWAQDRVGNLTPLLTAWIQNPLCNVYAQLFLRLLAGLLAPAFYCGLIFRRPADVWRATLVTDGLLLIVGSTTIMRDIFSQANPYGTSLALAGLATLALRASPGRFGRTGCLLIGTIGVTAAYVVNFGLVIVAPPLIALFAVLIPSVNIVRLLGIHLLGALFGYLLTAIAADSHTPMGLTPSFDSVIQFAKSVWGVTNWPFVAITLLPPAALLLLLRLMRPPRLRTLRLFLALLTAMLGVAALYFFLVAWSDWVALNLFFPRYFVPAYLLLISVAGVSLWRIVSLFVRSRSVQHAAFAGLAIILLLAGYRHLVGWKAAADRDIIGNGKSTIAREVAARYVSLRLDGIAGDYWAVWPAVLMAEQYHYDTRYGGLNVLGLTYRGGVRREEFLGRLATRGKLRVACIDLSPPECMASVSEEMRFPGLSAQEFSPVEQLSGGHRLWLLEITPPQMHPS
jgi:hypothetical protein